MTVPDELAGMLDRITQGRETESDRQLLQQMLRQEWGTVQLGKYNVNLGEGREIHIGDRIYQGADAETLKALLQAVLQQPSVPRSPLTTQEYRNRQALLSKVKNFWIKGVLETSLHHQVAIQLGLEDRSNLLVTPWNLGLEVTDQAQPCLPENTTVVDLFDQLGTGRTLLILGEPGAGKTITLLQLARELIARSEQAADHLIPVVFNLSTWSNKFSSIGDWLVAELNTKYQIPQAIAHSWITQQRLLLLLDGLDEVRVEYRETCVTALNQFQQRHGIEMVVCSRIKDYEALSQRLALQQAIYLRSLLPSQIDPYLNQLKADLIGLRRLLVNDAALQELARSPLMLNILVLAYEGIDPQSLPQMSVEAHRQQLFSTYIDRMLKRRGAEGHYSSAQTMRWLSWLAQQLVTSSQTIFLIEWLDRSWLRTAWQRGLYIILSSLIVGLAFGLVVALSFQAKQHSLITGLAVWAIYSLASMLTAWLAIAAEQMQPSPRQVFLQRLTGSLWTGLLGGLLFGLVAGVVETPKFGGLVMLWTGLVISLLDWRMGGIVGLSFLKPVEALKWSWTNVSKYLLFGLIGSVPFGLLVGLTNALGSNLFGGLGLVLLGGLIFGLLTGLRSGAKIETHTVPNQGIWRSAKTSVTVAMIISLGFSLFLYLMSPWLTIPLNWGLFYGLYVGLLMGGTACIVHISLRVVFYLYQFMPWNYVRFLDYAVDRIFLQKVGGGYIFIHRLLMEHFAAMPVEKRQ